MSSDICEFTVLFNGVGSLFIAGPNALHRSASNASRNTGLSRNQDEEPEKSPAILPQARRNIRKATF
jgi:hypothetical protein